MFNTSQSTVLHAVSPAPTFCASNWSRPVFFSYFPLAGVIISSTSLPFLLTTKGVCVRAAISRARCAARTKAAGAACMSASAKRDMEGMGFGAALMGLLLRPVTAALLRYCRIIASNHARMGARMGDRPRFIAVFWPINRGLSPIFLYFSVYRFFFDRSWVTPGLFVVRLPASSVAAIVPHAARASGCSCRADCAALAH